MTLRSAPVLILPLLALAAPAFAQNSSAASQPAPVTPPSVTPPVATPTAPTPLPTLSSEQEAFLIGWLKQTVDHGIGAHTGDEATLKGPALVRAVLDRARALRIGRVDTSEFLEIWALRPAPFDPLPSFTQAVAANRLQQWTNTLTPPYAGYEGLRKGLKKYEAIRDAGGWPKLDAKATPSAILARLAIEDSEVGPDSELTTALQRAQRRYGLNPVGILGPQTLAALNVPVEDRIAAIEANMERWRWLPRELPVDRIQVNIAAAVLTVFEGDKPVSSMRAVTGSPGNETPMLVSDIHSLVLNPPWNVPQSIAKRELWPKGRAALIAQGYKILKTPEGGERIVQPAGPNSALGRIKFDFDNPFAVYLHDTPLRTKFASYDRLASHGCVRLEKPVPLAERLLRNNPELAGRLQEVIDTGKTQRVQLPEKVSVYLLYWTAFASANGVMNFRNDPYGWDSLLARKIKESGNRASATAPVSEGK